MPASLHSSVSSIKATMAGGRKKKPRSNMGDAPETETTNNCRGDSPDTGPNPTAVMPASVARARTDQLP